MTPKQYDSSLAMKCVDTLWLHTVNTNVAWLWVLGNIKVICSWMTGPCIEKVLWCNTRQCALPMGTHPDNPSPFVQGSIPIDLNDIGVVQWAEIVWFLPASLMQDKEDCKSIPLMFLPVFSPHLHLFNLGYSTMVSITSSGLKQKKKKKESRTSQRWHFNSCWADKNNVPPSINSALWTHLKIMLCVCGCDSTRQKREKWFKVMMSCLRLL